jgi:hypothetical protein
VKLLDLELLELELLELELELHMPLWAPPAQTSSIPVAWAVPAQMWQGGAQSRCRCGRGENCPGAGVARGEPGPDAHVAAMRIVPVQTCRG